MSKSTRGTSSSIDLRDVQSNVLATGLLGKREQVCVTGAGGFIASWVVKLLLEKGYTVKGTVRNPENSKHLLAPNGASDRLQLVAADLLTPGAFDSIFEGCDGVFHTASVVPGSDNLSSEAEIEDVAIKGTLNVLESCAKTRPKRIVFTSSFAAVEDSPKVTRDHCVFDETFFTDTDIVRKAVVHPQLKAYIRGKTLAEEAAWDFVKKHNLSMVVMNPVMVAGPVIQPSLNATNEFSVYLLSGKDFVIPNLIKGWVGVKDVAKAHVLGYENPKAEGRYILSERTLHYFDFAALLQKLFPQYTVVARPKDDEPRVPEYSINTKKVEDQLGVKFEPLEDVLRETIECFRELKYLD